MADILVNHPCFGSLWLSNCRIIRGADGCDYVIGDAWSDDNVGSLYLPDDYGGELIMMNFPVTCIRKDPDGLTTSVGDNDDRKKG